MVSFGTRGDIRPLCLLAVALKGNGHDVAIVVNEEYESHCKSFGIETIAVRSLFDPQADSRIIENLNSNLGKTTQRVLSKIVERLRAVQVGLFSAMEVCYKHVLTSDLVIYNTFAFFVGELARELRKPAIHVSFQPLLPSQKHILCLLGGARRSAFVNKSSYQIARAIPLLLQRAFRTFRAQYGVGNRLRGWTNPLTLGIDSSVQLLAFSAALSPDPGDWPCETTMTGFWFDNIASDKEQLPAKVCAFLDAGEPPIYVGFGSMFWGKRHNTQVVLKGLEMWGGRAIISSVGESLNLQGGLAPNILEIKFIEHSRLFPHVSAVVHHGGAGTTAQGLRFGLPTIIFPMIGDQFFWGRRVAALGAGDAPIALKNATPKLFASRVRTVLADTSYRSAAMELSRQLQEDAGIDVAVERVEQTLAIYPVMRHDLHHPDC
ncbi:sterol 3beta-glucosyltransferase [Pararhizobium capsulatum DSM 1112]|uniref:Sterol 3beta-glucosyltransferase n=1 Tax=Pararhizobium capsulatum DSM 1112 TaxID=1121113 RepID=A0ABU0BZE5_9HYPH|nr:glycosyltransferase [Pararhizobium capsulatum]MDQ0323636.1 sterol 3beta-glucosyltransferase [Pararhizobium capsulatum DSM 1112]